MIPVFEILLCLLYHLYVSCSVSFFHPFCLSSAAHSLCKGTVLQLWRGRNRYNLCIFVFVVVCFHRNNQT